MPRNVLMIAYLFPPVGGVAPIRTVKFARYLPEFGWNPIILTVKHPAYAFYDEELAEQLPDDLPVYRSSAIQPTAFYFRRKRAANAEPSTPKKPAGKLSTMIRKTGRAVLEYTLFPDDKIGWVPFALRKAREIMREHPIDIIFTTCPPYSTSIIGARLTQKTGVPWVADFRDPFDKEGATDLTPLHRWMSQRIEQHWFEHAQRLVSVTTLMTEGLAIKHPKIPVEKWITITNGYDESDFDSMDQSSAKNDIFTIRYTGSLYRGIAPSFEPFLRGVRLAMDQTGKPLCVEFIGNIDNHFSDEIRDVSENLGISDLVRLCPPIAHREALRLMQAADALMVTLSDEERVRMAIHVKLFEYLHVKKPILAMLPRGAARDLLRTMDSAFFVDAGDTNRIAATLKKWLVEKPGMFQNIGHERYSRRTLTETLAETFDSLVGASPHE